MASRSGIKTWSIVQVSVRTGRKSSRLAGPGWQQRLCPALDASTGAPVGEPLRHEGGVNSASFSPDGARVVTASGDSTKRVGNAATGTPVGEPLRHKLAVRTARFSPDGTQLVTASYDKTARIWNVSSGVSVGNALQHKEFVWIASFSPDVVRVVTADADHTARVRTPPLARLSEPLRHEGGVISASFSPDGARVVTASGDMTVRVWNAATGTPLSEPLRHKDYVRWRVSVRTVPMSSPNARTTRRGSGRSHRRAA